MKQVENNPNWYKAGDCLINTNSDEYKKYLTQKKIASRSKDEISEVKNNINNITTELSELKLLIKQLIENYKENQK